MTYRPLIHAPITKNRIKEAVESRKVTPLAPVTQQYINQLWDKHNGDSFRPHPNYGPHVFWSVPLEWDNIENPDEKHKDQTLERPKVWVDRIIRSGLTTPLAAACDTKKETIYSWRRQGAPEKHFHKIYNFYLKAYEAHDNKT